VSKIDPVHDLVLLVRSGHQLLHLDTEEEERASALLLHVADRLDQPLFAWTRVRGLGRVDLPGTVYDTESPAEAFRHVAASDQPGLYHFKDLGPYLNQDAVLAAQMKEAAEALRGVGGAILVTGRSVPFPDAVDRMVTVVTMPGPTPKEYKELLSQIVRDVTKRQHVDMALTRDEIALLVRHLAGLTLMESEKILTKATIEDGKLAVDDIRHVIEAKIAIVEKDGLLEYYPVEAALSKIADLRSLKAWLAKRKAVVTQPERAEEFGLSFPRSMLLLGVPGCGKSLCAKAVAAEWQMPLLKLDPSNLYNKYIGESERNFKRAMRTAEQIAPVVLWIDELEKAFASGGARTAASPNGSWEAFSRGCRTVPAMCSSWPPPTISAGYLHSFCGRAASTRFFPSICRMWPRAPRSFRSIWKTAERIVRRSTWRHSVQQLPGSAARRSSRS
jgi:hypothetical protein